MACLPRRPLFVFLLPLAATLPVHADEADVINFRVSESLLNDSNLFRVSNSARPESETIATTIAGVDFNKKLSLQQFVGHVSWVDTRYAKNDYLNSGALHYDGKWGWAVGSHLNGEVAATRSAAQNSFADFTGLRQRNLRTIESQRFNLDYAVSPSWHVAGGVNRLTVSNDQPIPQESDFEADSAIAGVRYTPKSGNWIGFQTRRTEGRYTKRQFDAAPGIQFDNRYTETGQEIAAAWQVTGHSTFSGRLEFVRREHPHLASRDFSGVTGQLGYLYQYSAKTVLSATYLRGINAFQDVNSSYYVADELALGSRWDATAKVTVATRLGLSQRQYQGALAGAAFPNREDKVLRTGIDVSYKAERWLELKGGLGLEKRDSNSSGLNYTDRQLLLSAIARF